jgi:hypothetical protein
MLQAEAAELRAKVEKRNREVRELNQMLKAWEAMRHSKDRQIEQLVERCRKFEEEAAEKSRAVDAMRRRMGRDRPGSVTGTPTSMTRSVGRSGSGVGSVSFGGNHSRGGWLDDGEGDGRGGGGAAGERSTTRSAAGDDSFFSFGGGNAVGVAAGTARGGGGSSAVDKENPAGVYVGSPRASPKRRGGESPMRSAMKSFAGGDASDGDALAFVEKLERAAAGEAGSPARSALRSLTEPPNR